MRLLRFLLLSCAATTVMASVPSARAPYAAADTKDLLLRYAAGEFGVIDRADKFDASTVRRDLERLAPEFLSTPSVRPDLPRRALTSFALEVAAGTLMDQAPDAMRLLEWARQRVATGSTGDFERHWHLASLGLIEEIGDHAALERASQAALQQFPDDPRCRLAHALAAEIRAAAIGESEWAEAAARFAHAALLDAARAEAQIHLASVELRQNHHDLAIQHLAVAEAGPADQSTTYLVQLLRGRALGEAKRYADAEAAYRAALRAVPGAQSASMGLAVVLIERGDRAHANDLVDAVLKSKTVDDPWWHYWNVEYRFRDRRLADLRGDLK